jgi:hypothetical protein
MVTTEVVAIIQILNLTHTEIIMVQEAAVQVLQMAATVLVTFPVAPAQPAMFL